MHFQQVPAPFWEYVVFGIALAEAYRVSVGWANPAEKGAFVLKDTYEPGQIGYQLSHSMSFPALSILVLALTLY